MTACTNPACGVDVHWKAKRCKACGAEQVREIVTKASTEAMAGKNAAPKSAPIITLEPKVEAYVFMDEYRCQVGDVNCSWNRGDVLSDFPMIQRLKAAAAPIVPVSAVSGMACCPNCKTVFTVQGAAPLSRSAA